MYKPVVSIVMGSDSDLLVMQEAAEIFDVFGITYEISILSAHRTPEETRAYALHAAKRGIKVIIAGAGGAAHLAGVIASYFPFPVIGVPIQSKALSGIDSLYSVVQMPAGVPVATVAINGAKNAAVLAMQMLAITDGRLHIKLVNYKNRLKTEVKTKNEVLEKIGYKEYLANKGAR